MNESNLAANKQPRRCLPAPRPDAALKINRSMAISPDAIVAYWMARGGTQPRCSCSQRRRRPADTAWLSRLECHTVLVRRRGKPGRRRVEHAAAGWALRSDAYGLCTAATRLARGLGSRCGGVLRHGSGRPSHGAVHSRRDMLGTAPSRVQPRSITNSPEWRPRKAGDAANL